MRRRICANIDLSDPKDATRDSDTLTLNRLAVIESSAIV